MEATSDRGGASCGARQSGDRVPDLYQRRRPAETVLNRVVQSHLETVLALANDPTRAGLPGYAERGFRKYLACGSLAHGFARAYRSECGHDFLVAFSCKGRAICRSRTTRRMAESAAHPRTGLWWKQNHAKRCLTNRDSRTIDIATLG